MRPVMPGTPSRVRQNPATERDPGSPLNCVANCWFECKLLDIPARGGALDGGDLARLQGAKEAICSKQDVG